MNKYKNLKSNNSKKKIISSYRINPVYYYVFYACYSIINRDQLSDYLIATYYGEKDIPKRTNISQGIFLKKLLEDFFQWYQENKNIDIILHNNRTLELREYFKDKGITSLTPRRLFPVRIPINTHEKVKKYAKDLNINIGKIVEIAILFHIYQATEVYYDLVTFVIQYQFKKFDEEKG